MMSDTGGGHRASAGALVEALRLLHGDSLRCRVVDLFTAYGTWPLSRAASYYQPLVDRGLALWRVLWWAGSQDLLWRSLVHAALVWQGPGLRRFAADYPADLYVSVHPMLNHVPRRALHRRHPQARFATVVTDLASAPRLWYDRDVDLLAASCPAVRQAALRAGVPAERVRLCGLPIGLRFGQAERNRASARARLGLEERPTALLLGGGAGIGPLAEVATALAPALARRSGQLVVICGRNQRLRQELESRLWPAPVRVTGFVDDMPAWMAASDLLVTKAGPGTIAEALACGLPMILCSFVPGQETGNVGYVVANGAGIYRSVPQEMAAAIEEWLEPGNPALPAMRARALELARPEAALEIAQALSALL